MVSLGLWSLSSSELASSGVMVLDVLRDVSGALVFDVEAQACKSLEELFAVLSTYFSQSMSDDFARKISAIYSFSSMPGILLILVSDEENPCIALFRPDERNGSADFDSLDRMNVLVSAWLFGNARFTGSVDEMSMGWYPSCLLIEVEFWVLTSTVCLCQISFHH